MMNANETKWLILLRGFQKKEYYGCSLKVPDMYTCSICQLVLVDPVQTPCGCRFCKECLSVYLGNQTAFCPGTHDGCQLERISFKNDVRYDFAVSKDMKRLKMKCPNQRCSFEKELPELCSHLDQCPLGEQKCDLCLRKYVRKYEEEHWTKKCEQRPLRCAYCGSDVSFKDMEERHLNVYDDNICSRFCLDCPFGCNVGEPVCISEHRKTCSNRPLRCPLAALGCTPELVSKINLKEHLADKVYDHTLRLIRLVEQSDRQIMVLRQVNLDLGVKIEDLKEEIGKLEGDIELRLAQYERRSSEELSPNLGSEEVFRSGIFIWKIEEFDKMSSDAKSGRRVSVTSAAFYSSDFGYRMSLKIYPDGDGSAKGTHLSMYVVLMKGQYDGLLFWPFKGKVRVVLMSARDRSVQHSETYALSGDSVCCMRPEGECNVACGNPEFLEIGSVISRFVYGNTVFIQASIILPETHSL